MPTVGQQLLERQAGDLPADAVKAREHDRPRGVVDDEVDAGEVLQRADVAALAADDPALHVIGGQLHDRHRRLGGVGGRQSLHADREDVAHAALGLALGLLLDLADAAGRVVLGLLLDLLQQHLLGLGARHPGQALERALDLQTALGERRALLLDVGLALGQRGLAALEIGPAFGQRGLQGGGGDGVALCGRRCRSRAVRAPVEDRGDHDSHRDERCGTDDFHGRFLSWARSSGPLHCIDDLRASDRPVRDARVMPGRRTVAV